MRTAKGRAARLALLLAVALGARALYAWRFPQWGPGGTIPDLNQYETLAESLLKSGELRGPSGELSAAREPGYPLLLSLVYRVTGPSYRAGQVVNVLLGTATVLLILGLGFEVFGSGPVAWLGAAVAALYPQFVYYCSTLERETFQTFLLALAVWLLVRRRAALAGLAAAAAALTNSVFLPCGVALGAAAALPALRRGAGRDAGAKRRAGVFLAAFVALYALWPLRNLRVFGRPILGINGGGAHLYIGLIVPNDVAGTPRETEYVGSDPVSLAAERLPEAERDRLFYRAALRRIANDPPGFAAYMGRSLLKLWRLYPYKRAYAHGYGLIFWASLLSDGWIIPLMLLGALLARRRFAGLDLFYAALLSVSGVYAVFWSIVRYRLPMMPFAILLAAYALTELPKHARRAR